MSENVAFELHFALPCGDHDPNTLSDVVFDAGFQDAVVGVGKKGSLSVALETTADDTEREVLEAALALIESLPAGTSLQEVRPDMGSQSIIETVGGRQRH